MHRVCVSLAVLALGYATQPAKNTVWQQNDQLVHTISLFEENLVLEISDNNNPQKRSFSIIAEAILLYVTSNNSKPYQAVKSLGALLKEPSDVIAADPRKDLNILKSIIDQPINDIKRACRPDTTAESCIDVLHYYIQQQVDKCPAYFDHLALRDEAQKITEDKNVQAFFKASLEESQTGEDLSAALFFVDSLYRYADVYEKLRSFYKEFSSKIYPCRFPGPFDA